MVTQAAWWGFEHDGEKVTRVWLNFFTSPNFELHIGCVDAGATMLNVGAYDELGAYAAAQKWLKMGAPRMWWSDYKRWLAKKEQDNGSET